MGWWVRILQFSVFFFIQLTFLLLQHRFSIHNGKRKLKLAIFFANFVFFLYLFYFVNISWKMWRKVFTTRRKIVERVGRVTVNTQGYLFSSPNF